MLCNTLIICPATETPEFWQLQAQLEYTLAHSDISAVIKIKLILGDYTALVHNCDLWLDIRHYTLTKKL